MAVPAEAGFVIDVADAVVRITLNRPDKRNAQTPETWRWLARVGADLPGSVRVALVTGVGGDEFRMLSPVNGFWRLRRSSRK
jgi:enoyl-CoA hydratase/carnithine racemase